MIWLARISRHAQFLEARPAPRTPCSISDPAFNARVAGHHMPIQPTGPGVGEHNARVFAEFGVDAEELASPTAQGLE